MQEAYGRYRWRAFLILLYRALFSWPRTRSAAVALKLRILLGASVGAGVRFGKNCFISIPGGRLTIGDQSWFSDRCVMLVSPKPQATLQIGSDCFFARDVHFSCYGEIKIGDNVRIAEFCSLHDSPHSFMDRQVSINRQGDIIGAITIKDDVWIGQGVILLGCPEGLVIGKGAVIGAHSVVKESIPDFAVAVGSPAKVVKYRR